MDTRKAIRWRAIGMLLACLAGADAAPVRPAWDAGPFGCRRTDLHGADRLQLAGPLYESARDATGRVFRAARPFYAFTKNPATGWENREFLWPIGESQRLKNDLSWRVLLAYGTRFDAPNARSRYRFWLLPFYFQGRDIHGETYHAVFPLGGRIHEFLFQDRIAFFLFPLWARSETEKSRTWHVLWPILSRTTGPDTSGFRIFPLYGRRAAKDRYEKRFVCWPFWTQARYLNPAARGYGYVFFPFYGRMKLDDQSVRLFLPPFIRIGRSQQLRSYYLPWPFVQIGRGAQEKTIVWPIYGDWRRPGYHRAFAVWPIAWRERIDRGDTTVRRHMLIPFLQYETQTRRGIIPAARGDQGRLVKIWPLLTWRREGTEREFRALDLWPLRRTPVIERNWAPFWTLWRFRAAGEARETDLLWGLYRHYRDPDAGRYWSLFPLFSWAREGAAPDAPAAREWQALKGLLGRRRVEGAGARWQLLYIFRWGGRPQAAPDGTEASREP